SLTACPRPPGWPYCGEALGGWLMWWVAAGLGAVAGAVVGFAVGLVAHAAVIYDPGTGEALVWAGGVAAAGLVAGAGAGPLVWWWLTRPTPAGGPETDYCEPPSAP